MSEQGLLPVGEVPELIPARMLNEFCYCPRLAYLEWVQGEFQDNLETVEGRFGHRRVDAPSTKHIDPPSGRSAGDEGQDQDTRRPGGRSGFWASAARRTEAASRAEETADVEENPATDANSRLAESSPDASPSAFRDPQSTIHSRSLMLSAPQEGLIARIDVLELDGDTATPVDYKRGKAPQVREGAWEPERVQLCAQGLILREAGYRCQRGVLYFIDSRRRVEIPFDEALVRRTRELIGQFRLAAAAPQAPPPLVDSPKCPRCSLVGICLPDEMHLLKSGRPQADSGDEEREPGEAAPSAFRTPLAPLPTPPRRLIPTRDDALPLYVNEQGAYVGKDGERLAIKLKDRTLSEVKLKDISQVAVFGNVQVSSQALRELSARGVPVCYFSYGGWFQAMTTGLVHKNVDLRRRQFELAADPQRSLALARRFVAGKIKNCRTLLRRNLPEKKDPCLTRLAEFVRQAERANSAETLLGLEGMAAKVYFAHFGRMLKGGPAFDLDGRNRRPPTDPVNCLLSFLYALLTKDLTVTLQAVGFDPMLGFFHRPRYGRPSLALDLTEEFRPLVADSTALMLVNNGEVKESDFLCRAGAVALKPGGRKAVLAAYERRMDGLATHPIFGYRISYRRILEVQARLLARTVLGELDEYPNYCTR